MFILSEASEEVACLPLMHKYLSIFSFVANLLSEPTVIFMSVR